MIQLDSIVDALADLGAGKPVVVVDDEDRENEGDLICAAQFATPELVSFLVRYSSGYLCVALPDAAADRLELPAMVRTNEDPRGTAYTVTVDARAGISTGISAHDRARTARLLADPSTGAADLNRPGHLVPLRARQGGVLERAGHTEAAVDLMRLAGLDPAGVLCEVVSERDPTGMARLPELLDFARRHGLRIIRIADLVRHLREPVVRRVVRTRLPLRAAGFDAIGYRGANGSEHIALVLGDIEGAEDVPVRVHSECLTGDVFGSLRCDCGARLEDAFTAIGSAGHGALVYVRGQGPGLLDKLRAYQAHDANALPGPSVDARDYAAAAAILGDLGVRSVRLLSDNKDKLRSLRQHGVEVTEMTPLPSSRLRANNEWLRHQSQERTEPPVSVIGTVVHGDARGRTLGFPTANLRLRAGQSGLADGVYGGIARVRGRSVPEHGYLAAISVGSNPTFAGTEQRFEVHFLDFDDEIYGCEVEVVPLAFVRPTLTFDSVAMLTMRIKEDLEEIRRISRDWPGYSGTA